MATPFRWWAVLAAGLGTLLHPPCASAQPPHANPPQSPTPPIDLADGVVVIAASGAPLAATWSLATSVYAHPKLRPRRLEDATARVLAGEPPPKGAPAKHRELAELRADLRPQGASARRLLSSLASEYRVAGVLVVYQVGPAQPRARLFVSARGDFAEPVLWPRPVPAHEPSWQAAVTWLGALSSRGRQAPSNDSAFASPWFWGALAAAAGAAVVGYAVTRDDNPNSIHLQGRVNP